MGLFGKIATLASVGLPAKAVKNAIAGRAASAATKTTGGTPPPPPPPGAGGAGGSAARAKTMTGTGGTGGFQSPPPPPPPPKAGQTVYAAGADFKKTKAQPVRNAWREGGK